ncbi:T9SS type A sorting domain-containing protein [bacterium]|nr:T9SS type A sorting domain-containing protein [bacterium]
MKYFFILKGVFILICFSQPIFAEDTWTTYRTNIVDTITALAVENNTVWIGTPNGLAAYDKTTGASLAYTTDDGLVDDAINGIAVDRDGVKWIATNGGVSRFDGTTWISFQDTEKIGDLQILDVTIDNNNIKWFISRNVVSCYNGQKWTLFKQDNGAPAGLLKKIMVDKNNTIWIGTWGMGIISFDGEKWTLYNTYQPNVVSIAVDNKNTIWFGDYNGSVISYDGNEWSSISVISSLWHLYSVETDSQGALWVGTHKGLFRIKDDQKDVFLDEDGLEKSICRIVKAGNGGEIWLAGNHGLTRFDGVKFTGNISCTGPADMGFFDIAIDHDNVVWFGHKTDKITYYDKGAWHGFTIDGYSLIGESIAVSPDNVIWFTAGFDGALFYDGVTLNKLPIIYYSDIFPYGRKEHILEVAVDYNNNVLFRSAADSVPQEFPGHIFIYYNGILSGFKGYRNINKSLLNIPQKRNAVAGWSESTRSYFCIDSKNYFWKAEQFLHNNYGLTFYTDDNIRIDVPINIEQQIMVYGIYADSNNTIWIPSNDGIYYYNGENLQNYTTDNSGLVSDNTLSVAEDMNHVLWIGTDAGVSRFDGENWTTFFTQNSGLCNKKVNAIAIEKNNTIWFGTDNGVSRYTGEVIITSVDENETKPEPVPIIRSFPNPFNPSTTIEFVIPDAGFTTLTIYNIAGQKVRKVASERMTAGTHRFHWDGKDNSGAPVSAGIYFARLTCGGRTATGKIVMVK